MGTIARVLVGVQGGRTATGVPILTAFAVGIALFMHASENLAVGCVFPGRCACRMGWRVAG